MKKRGDHRGGEEFRVCGKKVCKNETNGLNWRSRPLKRWKCKVKKCMNDRGPGRRGRFEQAKKEC